MMSIEYIVSLRKEAAHEARRMGRVPLQVNPERVEEEIRRVPNLGDYRPKGWKLLPRADLFVDKSGFGQEDEPALTFRGLCARVRSLLTVEPGLGFGMIEEGQFQAVIGVFRRRGKKS